MQSQQYTLTNRLMGDPRPDRFEYSRLAQQKLGTKPLRIVVDREVVMTPEQRRVLALKAIADGVKTVREVAERIGCKYDATVNAVNARRDNGLVTVFTDRQLGFRGVKFYYSVSPAGYAELERVK